MKLLTLRITKFRSFKQTAEFVFPSAPGLYFLWGDNKVESRLEANGAGKSSLWEALTWVIYGKTSKGLKAGDAANWEGGKGSRVELDVMVGGKVWTLTRTWSPIACTLRDESGLVHDLTKDESNTFAAALSLDFQSYLNCVLMAQGQPMFPLLR